ncbi:hypothetical protein GCM10007977_024980 [Dactylosporangium sucinum]|uniref:Nudix hydrolase domain-containing protein n=2 Tax=Dactylosporangium sucinum TaxID=1424081 RepID=A0A917TGU5_9ACTN|nr:hypothetical protein GCM10007977_024980 [Dactylosporangium sucinum]
MTPADIDRLRAAIAAVAQERNSGDGAVSLGHVDALLDAAAAVLPQPTGTCELCGTAGVAVRIGTDPDPRVPQLVCRDLAACARRCEADEDAGMPGRTYTHPDVLTAGVRDGWADPETDPTRIDWAPRQAAAAIPFRVLDGRPVNPRERTGIRYGRNELGHWGERLAADALVTVTDQDGRRWIVMVERDDGHGWALPGGMVEPGEDPITAARRELEEETGLRLDGATWRAGAPRYVPDPRASDEAWMVTVLARTDAGVHEHGQLPEVVGADDAARAAWVLADTYLILAEYLATAYGATVFPAHVGMLDEALDGTGARPPSRHETHPTDGPTEGAA